MTDRRDDARAALLAARAAGLPATATADAARALAALAERDRDAVLAGFAAEHGAGALGVLTALAGADGGVRRAARRALYRLARRGIAPAAAALPSRPVVARRPPRAIQAWLSGIDGSGARATWIVFEGEFGGLELCSLIVDDTRGIVEVAGGGVTRKRLVRELAALRDSQKLPWIEVEPARAVGLVRDALAVHAAARTAPPAGFTRWRPRFETAAPATPPALPAEPDPARVEASAALLALPELAGWFLDPASVQADALEMLEARESRLVVPDQVRAERQDAIVTRVVSRELGPDVRRRWARRLGEMALVFDAVGRRDDADTARAAAAALGDLTRDVGHHPLARALAGRGLEVAGDVALGRRSGADVQRSPGRAAS